MEKQNSVHIYRYRFIHSFRLTVDPPGSPPPPQATHLRFQDGERLNKDEIMKFLGRLLGEHFV